MYSEWLRSSLPAAYAVKPIRLPQNGQLTGSSFAKVMRLPGTLLPNLAARTALLTAVRFPLGCVLRMDHATADLDHRLILHDRRVRQLVASFHVAYGLLAGLALAVVAVLG